MSVVCNEYPLLLKRGGFYGNITVGDQCTVTIANHIYLVSGS